MTIFPLILWSLALLEALYSLLGGWRFLKECRRARARLPGAFTPAAALIIPCRGLEAGLQENLEAFLAQEYPDLAIVLVTDSEADPSLAEIRLAVASRPEVMTEIVIAGPARGCSQKIHNLRSALRREPCRQAEVLVFADSDIRVDPLWVRRLVAPLEDPGVGASTGFRWYLPSSRGFFSTLRSVWNAGAVSLMRVGNSPFAWGGAMAISRRTFIDCGVEESWRSALSDDLSLSRALRDHGLRIRFEPLCLGFSFEECSFGELLEWTRRQLLILRVYDPRLWGAAWLAQSIHSLALGWGVVLLLLGPAGGGPGRSLAATAVILIYGLGCLKGLLRWMAVQSLYAEQMPEIHQRALPWIFWGPLASLVSLVALARSAWGREIEWRGIRYRLDSAHRTVVLGKR